MTDHVLLRRIYLGPSHNPTGKTRHYAGELLLPSPAELHIVKYSGDIGYYLLYLDGSGEEMTDTFHETIQSAMDQAEWEFQVKPNEWDVLEEDR
jgi:hypothetical protein